MSAAGEKVSRICAGSAGSCFCGNFQHPLHNRRSPRGGEGDVEPVCGNGNSASNSYHICGKYHGEGMYLF